ncbi:MAG: hypothetical protein F4X11_14705 [Acidobacteria bacterium]|nr:hypothetical protein [Acidobacteriota bacterium]
MAKHEKRTSRRQPLSSRSVISGTASITTAKVCPYEYTGAYVVGDEAKPFLDASVSVGVNAVLNGFDSPEATVIGVVARGMGKFIVEDEHRLEIFELFRWYRLGTGL